jgi:hypothetical protein
VPISCPVERHVDLKRRRGPGARRRDSEFVPVGEVVGFLNGDGVDHRAHGEPGGPDNATIGCRDRCHRGGAGGQRVGRYRESRARGPRPACSGDASTPAASRAGEGHPHALGRAPSNSPSHPGWSLRLLPADQRRRPRGHNPTPPDAHGSRILRRVEHYWRIFATRVSQPTTSAKFSTSCSPASGIAVAFAARAA